MNKVTPLALLLLLLGCAPSAADTQPTDVAPSGSSARAAAVVALGGSGAIGPAGSHLAAGLSDEARVAFDRADVIVAGKLEGARIQSILEVDPPIYVHAFDIVVDRRLSGGETPVRFHATLTSRDLPNAFEDAKPVLVAVRRVQSTLPNASETFEATWVSPGSTELEASLARTRSVLPDGLRWSVAQVPASKPIQWQNDYGDGVFRLTLSNDGPVAIELPGLVQQDGAVQWTSAVSVRDDAGRELRPRRAPKSGASPVVLQPGASIATIVDVKPFGIERPAGGSRYYYSFGLGDLRTSSFFYYTHELHGPQMGANP